MKESLSREYISKHPSGSDGVVGTPGVSRETSSRSNILDVEKKKQAKVKTFRLAFFSHTSTLFSYHTDLSAAGPPAKLKHIIQRRKRKQP